MLSLAATALLLAAPDCPAQLAWASSFAERNHAGFGDEVTAATRPAYDSLLTVLRADSVWWTPGQVKATLARDTAGAYRVRFFMRDHSEQQWTARVARNVLALSGGGSWVRRWPAAADDLTGDALASLASTRFAARDVAPGTVLVQIPTFDHPRGIDSPFADRAARMKTRRGRWYGYDDYEQTQPAVLPAPREVAVIVDRGGASSCEQFLLAARQSAKVTTCGDRSAGVLDYGDVRRADMPGSNRSLNRPVTRSMRLPKEPIDNVGIPVQVAIPAGEPSPVEWVLRRMGVSRRRGLRDRHEDPSWGPHWRGARPPGVAGGHGTPSRRRSS